MTEQRPDIFGDFDFPTHTAPGGITRAAMQEALDSLPDAEAIRVATERHTMVMPQVRVFEEFTNTVQPGPISMTFVGGSGQPNRNGDIFNSEALRGAYERFAQDPQHAERIAHINSHLTDALRGFIGDAVTPEMEERARAEVIDAIRHYGPNITVGEVVDLGNDRISVTLNVTPPLDHIDLQLTIGDEEPPTDYYTRFLGVFCTSEFSVEDALRLLEPDQVAHLDQLPSSQLEGHIALLTQRMRDQGPGEDRFRHVDVLFRLSTAMRNVTNLRHILGSDTPGRIWLPEGEGSEFVDLDADVEHRRDAVDDFVERFNIMIHSTPLRVPELRYFTEANNLQVWYDVSRQTRMHLTSLVDTRRDSYPEDPVVEQSEEFVLLTGLRDVLHRRNEICEQRARENMSNAFGNSQIIDDMMDALNGDSSMGAADAVNEWTRQRMRQEGFARQIMPPEGFGSESVDLEAIEFEDPVPSPAFIGGFDVAGASAWQTFGATADTEEHEVDSDTVLNEHFLNNLCWSNARTGPRVSGVWRFQGEPIAGVASYWSLWSQPLNRFVTIHGRDIVVDSMTPKLKFASQAAAVQFRPDLDKRFDIIPVQIVCENHIIHARPNWHKENDDNPFYDVVQVLRDKVIWVEHKEGSNDRTIERMQFMDEVSAQTVIDMIAARDYKHILCRVQLNGPLQYREIGSPIHINPLHVVTTTLRTPDRRGELLDAERMAPGRPLRLVQLDE